MKDHLHGNEDLPKVSDIFAIDSPHLARPFLDRRENMERQPLAVEYKKDEEREYVRKALRKTIKSYEWNKTKNGSLTSVILPTFNLSDNG